MDPVREKLIRKARIILNHSAFTSKTPSERKAVERMLVENGLHPDDLLMLQTELLPAPNVGLANQTNMTFGILDKHVLTQILLRLEPYDVLSTCQTDTRYAKVCSDRQVFRTLLETHYPDAFLTNNPHQQYAAITEGVETTYVLDPNTNGARGTHARKLALPQKPELIPGWSFTSVNRNSILGFINNPIFLARLSTENLKYMRENVIHKITRLTDKVLKRLDDVQYRQQMYLDFIEEQFKKFIIDYRKLGIDRIVDDVKFQQVLKEYMTDSMDDIQSLTEDLENSIRKLLEKGRPLMYQVPGSFIIKGNSIPEGTPAWAIIYRNVTAFKSREGLAFYIIKNEYTGIIRHYYRAFRKFTDENHFQDEGIFNLSIQDQIKSAAFNAWFQENNIVDPDLKDLTKESVYNYIMTHDHFLIGGSNAVYDFKFVRITF